MREATGRTAVAQEVNPALAGRELRMLSESARVARAYRTLLYDRVRAAYATGLNLEAIANATGISRASVQRIVTGQRRAEDLAL